MAGCGESVLADWRSIRLGARPGRWTAPCRGHPQQRACPVSAPRVGSSPGALLGDIEGTATKRPVRPGGRKLETALTQACYDKKVVGTKRRVNGCVSEFR